MEIPARTPQNEKRRKKRQKRGNSNTLVLQYKPELQYRVYCLINSNL